MIERAREMLRNEFSQFRDRVEFRVAYIPGADIPALDYAGVISNSLLHHFHDPGAFWNAVRIHARPGSRIFIADLRRPATLDAVDALVKRYASDAPEVLRVDFDNSLRAAFTTAEVEAQLRAAKLAHLQVSALGDRHLIVAGIHT